MFRDIRLSVFLMVTPATIRFLWPKRTCPKRPSYVSGLLVFLSGLWWHWLKNVGATYQRALNFTFHVIMEGVKFQSFWMTIPKLVMLIFSLVLKESMYLSTGYLEAHIPKPTLSGSYGFHNMSSPQKSSLCYPKMHIDFKGNHLHNESLLFSYQSYELDFHSIPNRVLCNCLSDTLSLKGRQAQQRKLGYSCPLDSKNWISFSLLLYHQTQEDPDHHPLCLHHHLL
jgi:hypothetical protein